WASKYSPASAQALLGGDFIDAIEAADGSVRVVIGDVSGHGPEEAALGAALRIGWRSLVLSGADQRRTLTHLDELFVAERNSSSLFTSLCDVLVDPDRERASVLSAGHEAPLLIGPASGTQLSIDAGPVIGLGLGIGSPQLVELPAEWAMLLFTDGIFEGRCSAGGRLGVPGFISLAAAHLADTPAPVGLSNLLGAVEQENGGPLPDDVALFLLTHTSHA
ncbi:MAG: PP2C family protein-serine/threonine phosphatase, partial [Ilumatobacteraceae bacterium]